MSAALEVRKLSKTFGGNRALAEVSMRFPPSSVTALLGQNGSGKSTLIKILAGFYTPDEGGEVTIGGVPLRLPAVPKDVHRMGLRFIHQELGLVNALSIADNFAFVNRFQTRGPSAAGALAPIRRKLEHERVASLLARFGIAEHPSRVVGLLDPTTKTLIALARAVQDWEPDRDDSHFILVLDEPTAALPISEVVRVQDFVAAVRDTGGAVVYVSHRIGEVVEVADRAVVLRDGRVVEDCDLDGLDAADVANMIIGRELEVPTEGTRRAAAATEVLFRARSLSGRRLSGVDFELRRGEIVGISGLLGCGRSELARILAGVQRPVGGSCEFEGESYQPADPFDALAAGVIYVPQDRREEGCIPSMSLQANLTLGTLREFVSWGWLNLREERRRTVETARDFGVVPPEPGRLLAHLSGGNQQKVVLAKAVRHRPRLLILDEPLQGIDVGAKSEIAELIRKLADEGVTIVVGSTDVEDLVGLCDRVLVLNRGHLVGSVDGAEITDERLLLLAATSPTLSAGDG